MDRPLLLAERACDGAAWLARRYLKQADSALERMVAGDTEGLHDTRVALRRLDSLLRSHQTVMPNSARLRRKVRRLARSTNRARDLEVRQVWLQAQLPELPDSGRQEVVAWAERLGDELGEAHAKAEKKLRKGVPRLVKRLRKALSRDCRERTDGDRSYAQLLAELLWTGEERLKSGLPELDSGGAPARHRLRIQIKRQRYLLALWRGEQGVCAEVESELGRWQDLLGDDHDLVLHAEALLIEGERQGAAAARHRLHKVLEGSAESPASAGLEGGLALASRCRQQQQALAEQFAKLAELFAGDGLSRCASAVQEMKGEVL